MQGEIPKYNLSVKTSTLKIGSGGLLLYEGKGRLKKTKVFYLLAVLIVSASLLCTVPAGAVSDEARRHLDRGQAAIEMAQRPADLEDAIREFQQAAALAPTWPDPYYQMGMLQDKLERYADALNNLRRYLQLDPQGTNAPQVTQHINKIEYKKEKAEKERLDPKNLAGVWWVDGDTKEGPGLFYRFEIRDKNGVVDGALRAFSVVEEQGIDCRPWFVHIKWDGTSLVIPHTRYFYCDTSVQNDCCGTDASLSLTMIAKDTLKGTLMIASYKDRDGYVTPAVAREYIWKRVRH